MKLLMSSNLSLSESLSLVSAGSVGHEGGVLAIDSDVVLICKKEDVRNNLKFSSPGERNGTWREISLMWISSRDHLPKSLTGLADSVAMFTQFIDDRQVTIAIQPETTKKQAMLGGRKRFSLIRPRTVYTSKRKKTILTVRDTE